MLEYDNEQTMVKIDLANLVFEQVIEETVRTCRALSERNF
jgi:hypothetical protein